MFRDSELPSASGTGGGYGSPDGNHACSARPELGPVLLLVEEAPGVPGQCFAAFGQELWSC